MLCAGTPPNAEVRGAREGVVLLAWLIFIESVAAAMVTDSSIIVESPALLSFADDAEEEGVDWWNSSRLVGTWWGVATSSMCELPLVLLQVLL